MKRYALLILLTLTSVSIFAAKDTRQRSKQHIKIPVNYGNATVSRVVTVENDFIFRCNIKDWPAIIAQDIPVKIRAIAPPDIVIKEGTPNTFYQRQAIKLVEKQFTGDKKIELRNVARGKTFSLVADVYVDEQNLADILIEGGIARKLKPGEKYPPEKKEVVIKKEPASVENKELPLVKIETFTYLASKSSKIFHKSTCRSAKVINDSNRISFATRQHAVNTGRKSCKICNP